ncbi:MAG: proline racemase family protein [Anaerolineales bacterium]
MTNWQPPKDWSRIETIDAHTAGEPFRVITAGLPDIPGETILERRRWAQENLDDLRRSLMWEPRGHADMYGCIPTPPVSAGADIGVLFTHNGGFSTMCGHGIIGIATVALETGMLPIQGAETPIGIDTPAGFVQAVATVDGDRVTRVRFRNVPSYVAAADQTVDINGLGNVRYDLAFGGAYYAFVDAEEAGVDLHPRSVRTLIERGRAIKRAVSQSISINHPFEEDLGFLYGTIFLGPPDDPANHSRNVCIFADGEVDRCPTGTGVSARLAIHRSRGEIEVGQWIEIESILGTLFRGRVVEETSFGSHAAVIPEVEGSAFITGMSTFLVDPDDPLKHGFLLR